VQIEVDPPYVGIKGSTSFLQCQHEGCDEGMEYGKETRCTLESRETGKAFLDTVRRDVFNIVY